MLLESLEARLMLDGEGLPWSAPNLTISFAPDGTNVAGFESTLFETFDTLGASSVWQNAIMQGFSTWAQHAAASVSTTTDSGDAFGSPGPTQGDPRFGDVRVAAIPMPNDIIAMSVPHDEVISGTWAGDILFNSNAKLNDIADVLAVAVHEAGHVFGLGHSSDPNSPMFKHGIAVALTPTPTDVKNLQRLYGVPGANGGADGGGADDGGADDGGGADGTETEFEREHSDDALNTANGLILSPNFQGAIRYDATGSIFDATDTDFYQLAPSTDDSLQANVLTVVVRATTPEGLIPTAVILDQNNRVVESTILANANGEFILQAKGVDPRLPYFVEVKAANDVSSSHATGGYVFAATLGTRESALDRNAAGTLKPKEPTSSKVLHISETRLVNFVFATAPVQTATPSIAWVVIYDANRNPVFRVSAKPGESRSANTLLLTPGDYQIEFHDATPDGSPPAEIDYRLLSRSISLPVGPNAINPTSTPILPCGSLGADTFFCLPPGATVADPLIIPNPTGARFPPPVVAVTPPWLDPAGWYWDGISPPADLPAPIGVAPPVTNPHGGGGSSTGGGGSTSNTPTVSWQNFLLPQDVNADNSVTLADVLLVVGYFRDNGLQALPSERPPSSPFVDVNNDGFSSVSDVLLVIAELRKSAGAAGEGEAFVGGVTGARALPQNVFTTQVASLPELAPPTKVAAQPELPNTPLTHETLLNHVAIARSLAMTRTDMAHLVQDSAVEQALEEAIRQIALDLKALQPAV